MAVLSLEGVVHEHVVTPRSEIFARLLAVSDKYGPFVLVVGDRTGSKAFLTELKGHPLESRIHGVHTVDEHLSSLEARGRYFDDHPPRGIRRFVPRTMLTPPVPYDDYVAIILGERYLAQSRSTEEAEDR